MMNGDFVNFGLLSHPSRLEGLQVWVDYYHAMSEFDANGVLTSPGLMDGEVTTSGTTAGRVYGDLGELNAVWKDDTSLASYRLDPLQIPTSQVSLDYPLAIRITIFSKNMARPRYIWTARKR